MDAKSNTSQYVNQVLELYRRTPGTLGRVRREDRCLAKQFQARGVALTTLEEAFTLAAARRCLRAPDAPPLNPIRSLHYFVSVIEEVAGKSLPDGCLGYLKYKLKKIQGEHDKMLAECPEHPSKSR
jgi:hypothetical protein